MNEEPMVFENGRPMTAGGPVNSYRYRNIAATWFSLGLLAGVVIAIPSACQPDQDWHITQGGK